MNNMRGTRKHKPCVSIRICLVLCLKLSLIGKADDDDLYCYVDRGERVCGGEEFLHLTKLEGGKLGEVKDIHINGHDLKLRTLSQKPLIFEIPGFLSDEECDHFVSIAKQKGLKGSTTGRDGGANDLTLIDLDENKQLNVLEMRLTIENAFDVYLDDEDILQMYKDTDIDKDGNGNITQREMQALSPSDMTRYVHQFVEINPEKQSRLSEQTWLYPDRSVDAIFHEVQERVSKLINLPIDLIKLSDFQIVKYGVKGHYNAHFDSSRHDSKFPCCERFDKRSCKVCRFMTILFYLNDVEEGGETAFVLAGNETVSTKEVRFSNQVNLYRKCSESKLLVNPAKGKVILWYNHQIDPQTGWMGEMDNLTLHGGCPVLKGEKWIANFWLRLTADREHDIKLMKTAKDKTTFRKKTEL